MKKTIFLLMAALLLSMVPMGVGATTISSGDLIKASQASIYYYGADGKRYVFPNEKTYFSWYSDFSNVKTITDAELAAITIGGNVTYAPGVKMVKIQTDPKVYAVSGGGVLRWVKTESLAKAYYGTDWNKKIDDVPDAFFTNYTVGSEIVTDTDYNVSDEKANYANINLDKGLITAPVTTPVTVSPANWTISTVNDDPQTHENLILSQFGSVFFATWNDNRNNQQEVFYRKTDDKLGGVDSVVRVSNNGTTSNNGKALFDGLNMYYLWEDSSLIKRAIYLRKIDINGNFGKESVFASTTYATSENPDFAWNSASEEYGVVWWDSKSDINTPKGDLHFQRMTKGGLKTGDELVVTKFSPSLKFQPKIISAGSKYAIVWQNEDNIIKFAMVDSTSQVAGVVQDLYTATNSGIVPKVIWSGKNFGIVWSDKSGSNEQIYFMALDSKGEKLADAVVVTSGVVDATEPDVAWNNSKFYITYTSYNSDNGATDIYLDKVSETGSPSGVTVNLSNSSVASSAPSIVVNLDKTAIAWLEATSTGNKILGVLEPAN